MIGLYDYDNASYEECIDDLNTVLEALNEKVGIDDLNAMEKELKI